MNELKIFQNTDFGQVRSVNKDGVLWFVAADVCKALEMDRTQTRRLDEDEKGVYSIQTPGGNQDVQIVNEPGLYSLVIGSRKPEARAFKRWITHEVIPAIRKHGAYATDELLNDPDLAIKAFTALKAEREARKALETENLINKQLIAEMKPKASYYDVILKTTDAITMRVLAKDYGKSAQWMNAKLHELGVQYKQDNTWLLYQKYAGMGYTNSQTHAYFDSEDNPHSVVQTRWTQKGRLWLYDLLKHNGIYPQMERGENVG